MLFEISLDYVVHNEFGNLILFNNNILETGQHSAVKSTSSAGLRAGWGFPSASATREAQSAVAGLTLTILIVSRCVSNSPQRSGVEAQLARAGLHICPTNSSTPGLTIVYL